VELNGTVLPGAPPAPSLDHKFATGPASQYDDYTGTDLT
jgi:hypothetical protein